MSEVSDRYAAIADGFTARVERVTPEQLAADTPCPDWTVADLVTHVITTHGRVISLLGDAEPITVSADGDLGAQWIEASATVRAALHDPAQSTTVVHGRAGDQTFESLVGGLVCADTLVHTWDLARATGQPEDLDPAATASALAMLRQFGDAMRIVGGFGAEVTAPEGVDPQTQLLNFCGRTV